MGKSGLYQVFRAAVVPLGERAPRGYRTASGYL